MYLAILGYLLIAIMMWGLLKGKFTPVVAFAVLPTLFALFAGFTPAEISGFVADGVPGTLNATALACFATVYFAIMSEEGLFDPIVTFLSKKAGNVVAIMIITSIISSISHMDTGVTSTVLVTIPAMLPLFKRFKIRVEYLFLLIAQSVAVVNLLPHGGGMIRMSSVTGLDVSLMFKTLLPIILCMVVYNLASAVFYGVREQRRIAGGNVVEYGNVTDKKLEVKEVKLNWRYWCNLVMTISLLAIMFQGSLKGYYVFMIGLALALLINYPNTKTQMDVLKKHASKAFPIALVMLASGVLVGVMSGTGMLTEMANLVVSLIPEALKNFYGVIVGYLSIPLSICLGADGFYYGLTPLFTQVGTIYGFSTLSIVTIMMLARDAFGLITPVSAVTYLAPGMLGKELGVFIKFSFKYLLVLFTVEVIICVVLGTMPLVV